LTLTLAQNSVIGDNQKHKQIWMNSEENIQISAQWIRDADGLLITAGAGMGVDSGLPDFRGVGGFWHACPALKQRQLSFEDMANPAGFAKTPTVSWGFYGHRLALYRTTEPHAGFGILRKWGGRMKHGAFAFTSNVDGQFQKAGFAPSHVAECHGTIHSLQCIEPCTPDVWPAQRFVPEIDEETGLLTNKMPVCPRCGKLARPNILMFGDSSWIEKYAERQISRLDAWLEAPQRLVVVELGAGKALPTVRRFSEMHGPRVIRLNPREAAIGLHVGVGIAKGAMEGLQLLDECLNTL
jgi:NAD-dependent SIR2 family protein deacetylase